MTHRDPSNVAGKRESNRDADRAYSDLSIEVCIISVDTTLGGGPPLTPRVMPAGGNSTRDRLVQLPRFDVGAPIPASGETSGPGRTRERSKGGYRRQQTYVRFSAGQGCHAQVPLRIRCSRIGPAPRGPLGLCPLVLDPASPQGGQGRRGGAEGGTASPAPSAATGLDDQEDPRREEGPAQGQDHPAQGSASGQAQGG